MTYVHTYNGYENRETWAFNLHWQNNEALYELVEEWARDAINEWRSHGQDDESGGYADPVIGEHVIAQAREFWGEWIASIAASDYDRSRDVDSDPVLMWEREVGSVWRVNAAEVGQTVREAVETD